MNMTKYETALNVLQRRRITIGGTVQIPAATLRKLAKGSVYIGRREAGIVADGEYLPVASDACPMAVVTLVEPRTDAERDALIAAVLTEIRANPNCGGSQYDPTCKAAWAQYRYDVAALSA